jgi:hypothetical protein
LPYSGGCTELAPVATGKLPAQFKPESVPILFRNRGGAVSRSQFIAIRSNRAHQAQRAVKMLAPELAADELRDGLGRWMEAGWGLWCTRESACDSADSVPSFIGGRTSNRSSLCGARTSHWVSFIVIEYNQLKTRLGESPNLHIRTFEFEPLLTQCTAHTRRSFQARSKCIPLRRNSPTPCGAAPPYP